MGHVKRLTVTCVDYRFIAQAVDHIKQECGEADLLSFPGASLAFVMPESSQLFLDWTRKLHSLHNFQEIELIDHLDCGAYKTVYAKELTVKPLASTVNPPDKGETGGFSVQGLDLERTLHEENLRQAAKLLASDPELGKLKIYTRLLTFPDNQIADI